MRREICPKLCASTRIHGRPERQGPDRAANHSRANTNDAVKGAILHQVSRRLPFLRVPIELDVDRSCRRQVFHMTRMLREEELEPHVAIRHDAAVEVMRVPHRLLNSLGDDLVAKLRLQHLLFVVPKEIVLHIRLDASLSNSYFPASIMRLIVEVSDSFNTT